MEMTEQEARNAGENKRKLATVRTIGDLLPIEGADMIEVAVVDGWKLVVKKGEFKVGAPCLYAEIDSFLPDGHPAWQFLVDKQPKMMNGKKGHKLRSIKLRGTVSQGLALPLSAVPEIDNPEQGVDYSGILGIEKFEAPLAANLVGQALGLFPSFIRKTDQERCQNLKNQIFGYDEVQTDFDYTNVPIIDLEAGVAAGRMIQIGQAYRILHKAQASRDDAYEISMKLDGSSMTGYARKTEEGIVTGVCSRNLELKVNEENASNSFVSMFVKSGLRDVLIQYVEETGDSIAVQGELMGPSIQGNRENLKEPEFYVFDIYSIDYGIYYSPEARMEVFKKLIQLGAKIKHVPILHSGVKLPDLGLTNVEELLEFAEEPSISHPVREGLVYKRMDGKFSWKTISNKFLLKEKD